MNVTDIVWSKTVTTDQNTYECVVCLRDKIHWLIISTEDTDNNMWHEISMYFHQNYNDTKVIYALRLGDAAHVTTDTNDVDTWIDHCRQTIDWIEKL